MQREVNYTGWVISACLIVLLASGIFNLIIDPYNIIQIVTLPGINTSKAGAGDRIAFAKTYMANKIVAKTMIVGSSKFDIGIDPDSLYLPESNKPAFNFAVPGSSVYDQYRYLQHAGSKAKPNYLVMEIGFGAFLTSPDKPENYPPSTHGFEDRLLVNYDGSMNNDRLLQQLKDYSAALLSNTATYDSFRTMLAGKSVWLDKSGLSSGWLRFGSEVRNKGYFSVFRDTLRKQMTANPGKIIDNESPAFKALDDIMQYSKDNNINLVLVMPPYHAYQYELWTAMNLWEELENWKQLIVDRVSSFESSMSISVPVWDFAYYNNITTENVPLPSDKTAMKWYWEPLHFKRSLGDVILKEIYSQSGAGVGVRLSPDNIAQHLKRVRQLKEKYKNENTDQLLLFKEILGAYHCCPS